MKMLSLSVFGNDHLHLQVTLSSISNDFIGFADHWDDCRLIVGSGGLHWLHSCALNHTVIVHRSLSCKYVLNCTLKKGVVNGS